MAQTEKIQKQNFEGIRFPTYGSIQHAVLFDSYSGRLVKNNLSQILIASTGPDLRAPKETIARKSEESINEIIGSPKK
jgi:hypothetical protein